MIADHTQPEGEILRVVILFTKNAYENAKLVAADGEKITVSAEVENIGGHQPDSVSDKLCGYSCLKIEL